MLEFIKKIKSKDKTIVNELFRNVVIVMIVSGLVEAAATFTDGICVSSFIDGPAKEATAALGIVNPMILFLNIFGVILQVGCQIYCSRRMASGKTKDVGRIFSITMISAVIVGLLFLIVNLAAAGPLATMLGARDVTHQYTTEYLRGFFIGAPFVILHLILMPLANLDGGKKLAYVSVFAILITNVVGDIITSACFHSVFGVGLVTSLSYVAGTLVLLIHFCKKKCIFHFSFKGLQISDLREIIIDGLPNGVKSAVIFARSFCVNQIILIIGGNIAMTAYSVQSHIAPFVESVTSGLIAASLMLSSVFYGEEDEESLNHLMKLIIRVSLTIVLALTILYIALAPFIAQLYNVRPGIPGEPEEKIKNMIFDQSLVAMRTDAVTIPFIAINASFLAILQGTNRRKLAYLCTFLQSFVIPLIFICALGFGMNNSDGIWYGMMLGFCSFIFVYLLGATIYNKKFPTNAREMFFLPKDFGYKEDQYISLPIHNINDALNLSNRVLDFCKKNNIDEKRAYHLAACVEELGVMTVLSGFTRSGKNAFYKKDTIWGKILHFFKRGYRIPTKRHKCEMRVLYKNNNLILRVRDDCDEFNIKEKAEKLNQEDPTRNMAIRLVMGLAKKVDYANILKTNNLIVTI